MCASCNLRAERCRVSLGIRLLICNWVGCNDGGECKGFLGFSCGTFLSRLHELHWQVGSYCRLGYVVTWMLSVGLGDGGVKECRLIGLHICCVFELR